MRREIVTQSKRWFSRLQDPTFNDEPFILWVTIRQLKFCLEIFI